MPEKTLSSVSGGAPDEASQSGEITNLDRLPDLPSATNNPIFQKLEIITSILFRMKNPDIVDPHQLSDEMLLANTMKEGFVYSTCLVEFVRRVAKGVISVEVMEANFNERMIKAQLIQTLKNIVDSGEFTIVKEELSEPGTGGAENCSYECPELEHIIYDIVENKLLTVEEVERAVRKARHAYLYPFFKQKFTDKIKHKPTFVASYYHGERRDERNSRARMERAHTLMDLSSITAEVENGAIPQAQASVSAGANAQVEGVEITFRDEEAPTLRMGRTLAPLPSARPPSAAESAELAEVVTIPGVVTEVSLEGEERMMPILLEREAYTIGTDPINDFVVQGDSASKAEPVHGMVFAREGGIYVKASAAPLQLEKEYFVEDDDGNAVKKIYQGPKYVMANSEEKVSRGQFIYLIPRGGTSANPIALPCFTARAGHPLSKMELIDEMKERFTRFTGLKADKLFQLLREKDVKNAKQLRNEILDVQKKLEKLDEAAKRYGIEMCSPAERAGITLDAMQALGRLLDSTIEKYYKNIARAILQHVEEKGKQGLLRPIDETDIRNHEKCAPAVKSIEWLFEFAREFNIPVMSMKRAQSLTVQIMEKAESRRSELELKFAGEEKEKARLRKENMQQMHERAEKIRQISAQYADVHLGENEVLDENTKFEYVGPVLKITDGHFLNRVDPLLIDEISIGDHPANTHQIPRRKTPNFKTQDFMARITREGAEMTMTWLGGSLSMKDTKAPLFSPTFAVQPGQEYKMASCRVSIEDNHAYTLHALRQVCPDLARELIEVVFNMDETSEGQDEDALKNLETLMETGYVDRRFVTEAFAFGMNALFENIMRWDKTRDAKVNREESSPNPETVIREEPMPAAGVVQALRKFITSEMQSKPLQDAHYLRTLKMLLDISGKNGLLPKFDGPGTLDFLKGQAGRRAAAYCATDAEKNNLLEQDKATLSLRALGNRWSEESKKKNRLELETLDLKSSAGAVQIARFQEMGLLDLDKDVAILPDASKGYIARIREIIELRELLHKFENGKISDAEIATLHQRSTGWKLGKLLSPDEIETDNHNIEMNLSDDVSVQYYIERLSVAMGRKALRSATMAQDPRRFILIITDLKNRGLLQDTDLMQLPEMPLENIGVILAELEGNSRYLDEQDNLKIKHGNDARSEFMTLQKVAARVDRAIAKAAREENLEALFEGADTVSDNVLALRMSRLGITLPAMEKMEGMTDGEMKALGIIAQINYQRDWESIRIEYRKLALELAKLEVEKILACDDADYRMIIIKKAVKKGLFTYAELGLSPEVMRASVDGVRALTQARLKETKLKEISAKYADLMIGFQKSEIDDLSYLKAIKLDEITDEDEKKTAGTWIEALSREKIATILKFIDRDEDVSFKRILARKIIASGYNPSLEFSPEEVAKLGAR